MRLPCPRAGPASGGASAAAAPSPYAMNRRRDSPAAMTSDRLGFELRFDRISGDGSNGIDRSS